jgi:hypothetical protein
LSAKIFEDFADFIDDLLRKLIFFDNEMNATAVKSINAECGYQICCIICNNKHLTQNSSTSELKKIIYTETVYFSKILFGSIVDK